MPPVPEGRYRNKWYQAGDGAYCGIGIHGQWLFVEPKREVVIVKMSSQPEPVDDALDQQCIAFFRRLATIVLMGHRCCRTAAAAVALYRLREASGFLL